MSTFPSVLTIYTNPTPTSPLNAPSHSGVENAQNSGLSQLEATVGLAGASSTLGTIIGDLRSPASNGGGHVQSANTGGTGQTSFSKGDILVAMSSSVLSKIAVGADNTVLKADSSQGSGVSWAAVVANKVKVSTSVASYGGSIASGNYNPLFSASIIGGTLGTNNAVRFTGMIENYQISAAGGSTFSVRMQYAGSIVAQIDVSPTFTTGNPLNGFVEGFLLSNGSVTDQKGAMRVSLGENTTISSIIQGYNSGASSVASASDNSLVITARVTSGAAPEKSSIIGRMFVVDKIV